MGLLEIQSVRPHSSEAIPDISLTQGIARQGPLLQFYQYHDMLAATLRSQAFKAVFLIDPNHRKRPRALLEYDGTACEITFSSRTNFLKFVQRAKLCADSDAPSIQPILQHLKDSGPGALEFKSGASNGFSRRTMREIAKIRRAVCPVASQDEHPVDFELLGIPPSFSSLEQWLLKTFRTKDLPQAKR